MSRAAHIADLLRQGIAAAKAGHRVEARQTLTRVVELDERNEQAWLWLSGVVDSPEDRRVCMENVLAINPDNAAAQAGLRWLDQQGEPRPSVAPTEAQVCPRCGAGLPPYGNTCTACGQVLLIVCPACGEYVDVVETACSSCGEPLGDFREGARYHLGLARAYLKRSHPALAEKALASAEIEEPDDAQLLADMAALYEALHRPDPAIATYERVVALDPTDATACVRLGVLYQQRGLSDKARALYKQANRQDGKDPEMLFALARQCLERDPTSRRAIDLLLQVARLVPKHAPTYLLLGRAYQARGKGKTAIGHYQRVAQLTTADSEPGREARHELAKLQPGPSYQLNHGWGETARRMSGLLLPLVLAAWTNARLAPLEISSEAWTALLAACAGAFLWASATDVPKNPITCTLLGEDGVKSVVQRILLGLPGALLWLLAFGLILIKV